MNLLMSATVLFSTVVPAEHTRTYLVSVVDLPLAKNEGVESFSFATWGVEFEAVCKIPGGWRIKAGNSATPDGVFEGVGSQGATWFDKRSPAELRNIILIRLYSDVQPTDTQNGPDATFKGHAVISSENEERIETLTHRNIRLTPARRCP